MAQLFASHGHKVASVVKYLAMLWAHEAYERFHEHGFARAALADDKVDLACLEGRAYAFEHFYSVERFFDVLYLYHCIRSFVSMTSNRSMSMELDTTALVDALPTSRAPPFT